MNLVLNNLRMALGLAYLLVVFKSLARSDLT